MSCFCRFSFNNDDVTMEGNLPSYSIPSSIPSWAVLAGQKGGRTGSGFAAKRKSASHHVVIARRSTSVSVEERRISRDPTSPSLLLLRAFDCSCRTISPFSQSWFPTISTISTSILLSASSSSSLPFRLRPFCSSCHAILVNGSSHHLLVYHPLYMHVFPMFRSE